MEQMHTLREIWETLGIKVRTLRHWIGTGRLPAIKLSDNHWYVPHREYIVLKERKEHVDKD